MPLPATDLEAVVAVVICDAVASNTEGETTIDKVRAMVGLVSVAFTSVIPTLFAKSTVPSVFTAAAMAAA